MSLSDFAARLATTTIPWQMARFVSWVLALNTVVTGWDYYHTLPTTTRSLTMVERLAPLSTWGLVFMVVGFILALGLLFQRHLAVWLGHLLCALMYVGFTIATAQAVWQFSQTPAGKDGSIWRAVSTSLVLTALHAILCAVRGPIPRKGDKQ